MYNLLFHPRAIKNLSRLHPNDRKRIIDKLTILSKSPRSPTLDVKKLASTKNSFRVRTGNIRAIFELDRKNRTVYIWRIGYRGRVY